MVFNSNKWLLLARLIKLRNGAKQSGKPERIIKLLNYNNLVNVKSEVS